MQYLKLRSVLTSFSSLFYCIGQLIRNQFKNIGRHILMLFFLTDRSCYFLISTITIKPIFHLASLNFVHSALRKIFKLLFNIKISPRCFGILKDLGILNLEEPTLLLVHPLHSQVMLCKTSFPDP